MFCKDKLLLGLLDDIQYVLTWSNDTKNVRTEVLKADTIGMFLFCLSRKIL